jgi:predicted kinase
MINEQSDSTSLTSLTSPPQTVWVMCGLPGSGKSTHLKYILDKYENRDDVVVLDGDDLKRSSTIVQYLKHRLNQGQSVIVDACNHTLSRRKDIIDVCRLHTSPATSLAEVPNSSVIVNCIFVNTPTHTCIERAAEREKKGGKKVPAVAIHTIHKNFVLPDKSEGFDNVEYVHNT